MIGTRVGYAGGLAENPDYGNMGDHTETVQVDYDPDQITYDQLLNIFWQSHKPTSGSMFKQYMNAVFYHDEKQRRQAMDSKTALEKKIGRRVKSGVLPIRSFTMAEDYHQKYLLKQQTELRKEMSRIYPDHREFVDSTAVSRLNGYAGGYGGKVQLLNEIERLGLSDQGKKALAERMNLK